MHAPMRGHRLPRPDRARFGRRLIADRKHKVHKWRLGSGELVPVLTAQLVRRKAIFFQKLQGKRVHAASRMTPGAERLKLIFPNGFENSFRHDAARRITSAQKQDIERSFFHATLLYAQQAPDLAGCESTAGT